jgi:hypothetical protein
MVQSQGASCDLLTNSSCVRCCCKQGGKPRTQEAKLAHAAAKASNRAMPTRFTTNLLTLYFWQQRLLSAVVEIE